MYELNTAPLPAGKASAVFAQQLSDLRGSENDLPQSLKPENVVRWADHQHRPLFAKICRRLLLPGSSVVGLENLRRLIQLASEGESCLLCLNHRSNLDGPTLGVMLEDIGESSLFEQLIWIAGRKLEEDQSLTSKLIQGYNRVLLTPHSWFESDRTEQETQSAKRINMAAERSILKLRKKGWVFALFPTGTRLRPGDETSRHAIAETDSYLRAFDHLMLCHISGCTLPVSQEQDFIHETPRLDRMVYTFGPIQRTDQWRESMASKYPELDQRAASARGIEEEIEALAPQD